MIIKNLTDTHHINLFNLINFISAGLLGSVIGLVLDKDKAEDLIPVGIQLKSSVTGKATLKHALMFFIMCGAGGAVFMALVFTGELFNYSIAGLITM